MTALSSKILISFVFLCVYIYGIKGRPNNLDDVTAKEDENNFEEGDLLKRSKVRSGGDDKGHTGTKGNKKQVIDAYHLGPYHHGHPWGTVSQWPGYHWGGHLGHHGGWTGYPSLGGWHRSHISKKASKTSGHKAASKRYHMLPSFAFPSYGMAYPSLGFAAVPFTPAPVPWGYGVYRSKVPKKSSTGETRSSVKGGSAAKRWWPGYMGGWGGWGIGNTGYPGWGPLGDYWGYGFDAGGLGHGWGLGAGDVFHPFLRNGIPGKSSKKDKAEKRWWPGYMGGWGGWGIGNTGYPGWGPLGADWAHGLGPYGYGHGVGYYGYGHGLGHYGYGHGLGPYSFNHGFGLGYGYGHGYRTKIAGKKEGKQEESPKRQFIHEPYGAFGFPWYDHGPGFPYGPFGTFGSPFVGHGAYVPYPEALYGDYEPFYGLGPYAFGYGFHGGHGFYKSKIPTGKSTKVAKEPGKEEEATGRNFVHNFNPGRYGWGGAIHPGHGYHATFPLLGALTHSGLYGGYYGPYGPPLGSFGPYHRSDIPDNEVESYQRRQVINYHPGCYGWGGCIYPGCGCIGGWRWPLPCHFFHHHHHCAPCWTRSNSPKKQDVKEEKGSSRQEIADPGEDEGEGSNSKDPQTRPHLEGTDLLNSEMQHLAMGFPGVEKLQTPMGESGAQSFSNQEMEENKEAPEPEPETAQAAPSGPTAEEAAETIANMGGLTPDESGNGFRAAMLGNMEGQQDSQQQSAGDLMSSFNMNPSEGELPAETFGDSGNPNMYSTGAEEQTTESASRRADIPGQDDETVIKKQAVTYPYHYLYPGYMMQHAVNPYYHYTPINYAAAQHVMAYPSAYPLAHPGLMPEPLLANHPSHSIHVGAPNVNVDVHTTREHVAQNPEKQKEKKLKKMMGDFSKKLKFKAKKSHSLRGRRLEKRQISSAFPSPIMNRPMGLSPAQFRSPVPNIVNTAGLFGQSMYPSMQQSLQQPQPIEINAMGRSGLPSMTSPTMGPAALRLSAFRNPQMRSAFNPAEMGFSRQLSRVTGISLPISAHPGMGIVGMASRKKRSPSKKVPKKHNKSTKRQFLAGLPQPFQPAGFSPFALPVSPFMGVGLPSFPTIPTAQTRPMAFRSAAQPAFSAKMPQPGLSAIRMSSFPGERMPGLTPFNGFPPAPNNPFLKVPQPQNPSFFSGGASGPWSPSASDGQFSPEAAFKGAMEEGFPQGFEGNPGPLVPEIRQGGEEPFQMNGEQLAGFNPASMGFGEQQPQQPSPMFSERGGGTEGPGSLSMGPQREMASFFGGQFPQAGGLIESNSFNMRQAMAALKKSSVPKKKIKNGKSSKLKRD